MIFGQTFAASWLHEVCSGTAAHDAEVETKTLQ